MMSNTIMIKPLLRILPSLSGNVKLACTLTDVSPISSDNKSYEANIRGARLLPVSSQLWQKPINANLISSTWEYDLPKFYAAYSDVFYKSCFEYNKDDMLELDKTVPQYTRARDFEFGVKRISYSKNQHQFGFFAPVYIDNASCIPEYFLINVTLYNTNTSGDTTYAVKKTLRVNIGINRRSKKNYIYRYLYNYANKIDDSVAFCMPLTNQATYYGIDLLHSGFVTSIDNMMERVYRHQNTIHNFDATVCGAFERNKIAMKQIMPLCYYFSVDDILTDAEKIRYRNCRLEFSGAYYDCNGNRISMYDFSHDYMQYAEDILTMNPMTGSLQWSAGKESNIMDVIFPSLNDMRYIKYEYANKLAPWFCRWKMKYSDDEHPYIMNNSWAFSSNQDSNYRYAQFPSTFHYLQALADYLVIDGKYNYNMMLPIGDIDNHDSGRALYAYAPYISKNTKEFKKGPFYYIIDRYRRIIENYCSNWFSVTDKYDDIFYNDALWKDTKDDCVYYNGILYDLRNVYDKGTSGEKIDKFAVILQPVMSAFTEDNISELSFSKYSLYRQNVSQISNPNAVANDSILASAYIQSKPNMLYVNDEFDTGGKINQDEIRFNEIFKKTAGNTGNYIDMTNTAYSVVLENGKTAYGRLDLDYYKLNRYYTVSDMDEINRVIRKTVSDSYYKEDKEMQSMIRSYIYPYYGEPSKLHNNIYTTHAYLYIPVYKASNITYSDVLFDNENILKSWNWNAYINPFAYSEAVTAYNKAYAEYTVSRSAWLSYNLPPLFNPDSYIDNYRTLYNSSIIDIPVSYADKEYHIDGNDVKLFDILSAYTYVRHSNDDPTGMLRARVDGKRNQTTYSYISTFNSEYNHNNYGSQLYFKTYLINSAYIQYMDGCFDTSYLNDTWSSYSDDLTNHTYLFDWSNMRATHPAAYWAGRLTDWKVRVSNNIQYNIHNNTENIQEYEYTPVLQESGNVFAENVFKERSCWTGHFYGDAIPQSKVEADNDVLWADPYNFTAIFNKEGKEIPKDAVYKDMYVKFLNKSHLFYWYVELSKDKDKNYDCDINEFLQDKWYKYLYIVEKKLIYDYGKNSTPQVKLIYTPLEKLLEFPEYYISDDEDSANNQYRSFSEFYNRLQYDSTDDFYTLPGFFDTSLVPEGYSKFITEDNSHNICIDTADGTEVRLLNETIKPLDRLAEYGSRYERISYSYIGNDNKLQYHYEPIKFELVYRKPMYRVDKELWDMTHMSENIDNYRDIYFYRLLSDIEHDVKYDGNKKIDFMSDLSYIKNDLTYINTYTYTYTTTDEDTINGVTYIYKLYHYGEAEYSNPHKLTDNPMSYIQQSDSMLVPLFDDVFMQSASDSQIYTHYTLHDVSECRIVSDRPNKDGKFDVIKTNYRYNKPDKLMMMDVSEAEQKKYMFTEFTESYEKYDQCYSQLVVKDDDLNYGEFGLSTKVMPDGVRYGFYYINSYLNNTSNAFNIIGISKGEALQGIKYFKYINGVNIIDTPEYVSSIYKHMLPFINQQPLNVMANVNSIIYPKTYPIDLIYSQKLQNSNNSSRETDIVRNDSKLRTMSLLRYFHAMTPWIMPAATIQNEWRLKMKDVKGQMLDTGNYLSIGDAPIYNETVHIDDYKPCRVYSTSYNQIDIKNYNNVTSYYTPLEYKFYNDSVAVNLEPHFEIPIPGKMTYDELLNKESEELVFELFKKRLNGRSGKKYDDTETLFLLNKYKVSYNSTSVCLNMQYTEKLYTLTIVFDLL